MKIIALALVFIAGLLACNSDKERKATIIHMDTGASFIMVRRPRVLNDTLVRFDFSASDTDLIATAQTDFTSGKPITFEVAIASSDSLCARLVPQDSNSNLRFNRIILPNGKTDGPFGSQLCYLTPKPGTYKLVIGENQMQGNKWNGKFQLKVWVK